MNDAPRFTDAAGHEWPVIIKWAGMRRAANAGVDLSKVELYLGDWFRGSHTLVDALYAVLHDQCAARKPAPLSKEEFEDAITGLVVPAAAQALVVALQNFFPPERAELLAEALEETKQEFAGLRDRLKKLSTEQPATSE
jgi:hypothetical protein